MIKFNFIVQSCPEEIIDLIFAETLYCLDELLKPPSLLVENNDIAYKDDYTFGGRLYRTPLGVTDRICTKWLNLLQK